MLRDDLGSKRIAIIGAAFKKDTDDIREAAVLYLCERLIKCQAKVAVYDPLALENLEGCFGDKIEYCHSLDNALKDADLTIIALDYAELFELRSSLNLAMGKKILDLTGSYKELKNEADINYVALY